jgi:aarF domain-containing kinase
MQADLSLEANNLWRFNKNFSHDRVISLPTPLYPWVSRDILMQSFEEGIHISDYMEIDNDVARRAAVAEAGSHGMLNMMLVHNLIHSDLHPGNILVRWQLPDGPLVSVAAALMQWLSQKPPQEVHACPQRPHGKQAPDFPYLFRQKDAL